jgi:flagellar basal body-associated protein FliL
MISDLKRNIFGRVFHFYYDGFSNISSVGKKLWIIILIKLIIIFVVLKLFFFPNFLNTNFDSEEERSDHVIEQLTKTS